MLTPALRSSASFSGVLTFGPKIPHETEGDVREFFGNAAISNRGQKTTQRASPIVAIMEDYMQMRWRHQYPRVQEHPEARGLK